jgi:hypothetical protein
MTVTLSEPRDRFNDVYGSGVLNGIDYVEILANPDQLAVHFINAVQPLQALIATITGGDGILNPAVAAVQPGDWGKDANARPMLTLNLPNGPGDFSTYTLTLTAAPGQNSLLDPYFNSVIFSFKALCSSDFDCAPPPHVCPPDDVPLPDIDYTAKDFGSFVAALSAFSAQNYPNWQERSEADFGMVMMEALAAIADEFSYLQDRVAAEAAINTATQRRSLVSLARLVDYEPAPVQSATTMLLLNVAASSLPAGIPISAAGADGQAIVFETGTGLADTTMYQVSPAWNYPIPAYWWDDSARCLPAGATQIWVQGNTQNFQVGMQILVQTDLPGLSLRQIVTLTGVQIAFDNIYPPGGPATAVTLLSWGAADALTDERNLTQTYVGGNLVPATQGMRVAEYFGIASAPGLPLAIARRGPNATDAAPNFVYRRPLANSPVAWLPPPPASVTSPLIAANALAPEIQLTRALPAPEVWNFTTTLLNADAQEPAFTIDPVAWRAVAYAADGTPSNYDMDGDGGESIRFGDGVFGLPPNPGDVFSVLYRVGAGAAGNVAPDGVSAVTPAYAGIVTSARNPFAATGGADAESNAHIRNIAPYAFQATQFRDVQPGDYVASAETLPWVYRAGCAFRWSGSWLTAFTVADPEGTDAVTEQQKLGLVELLNRRRLAGYESYVPPAVYISLDLVIDICVAATAIGPNIEAAVLSALNTTSTGFFFADRFTFGTPLYRSVLEATIQAVPGVNGILRIRYRQRGVTLGFKKLPDVFAPPPNAILRIENNPDFPERGTLKVIAEGGQ